MKFKHFLRSLLPDFWLMLGSYSASWDRALNLLLDKYEFKEVTRYTAHLGPHEIWIANIPYGAFTPIINGSPEDIRPSRTTIARARETLNKTTNPHGKDPFKDTQ